MDPIESILRNPQRRPQGVGESIMAFLSPEAGQRRTKWLNDKIGNAADYYLGPTGLPDKIGAVNELLNPVQDMSDSMAAARDGRYLDSAISGATVLAPVAAGKLAKGINPNMADDAAQWLEDALTGVSVTAQGAGDAAKGFALDESGAVGFREISDEQVKEMGRYYNSRRWSSAEEAREQIRKKLQREADNDRYGGLFGPPTDPGIVDRLNFVKSGNSYKISQKGTGNRPDFISSPDSIGRAPDASWGGQDLQDYRVAAQPGQSVDDLFVSLDSIPQAKLAGGKSGYDWTELQRGGAIPPVTLRRNPNGSTSIIDGNHRIQYFRDQGYDSVPAYVISGKPNAPSPAQSQSQAVLDLLTAGRASEVTDDMLAGADDMYLFNNYDLPMDEASRLARAQEMGFDTGQPAYHGTQEDIQSPKSGGFYTTQDPDYANIYSGSQYDEGGQVISLSQKNSDIMDTRLPEDERVFDENFFMQYGNGSPLTSKGVPDWVEGPDFEEMFSDRDLPYSGVLLDEGKVPLGDGTLLDRGVSALHFNPANIRSRFARFDPRLKHLANLSAAGAGAAVMSDDDMKQKIRQYLKGGT